MEESRLENVVRKLAIAVGLAMLIASMYLSYDGFDQSVSGDNPNYSILAAGIGITLAVAFTLAEFIVTSRAEGLNSTLKWLGLLAYVYSIATNYLGLQHLLQMNVGIAVITAVVMDVFPEQMIAWGLGEAVMHDLFGNLGKFASAPISKGNRGGGKGGGGNNNHGGGGGGGGGGSQQRQPQFQQQQRKGNGGGNYPSHGGQGGGSNRRAQLEAQFRAAQKSGGDDLSDLSDTGKFRAVQKNFE